MSVLTIASRYAKSIMDLAIELNKLEEVCQDMILFSKVAASHHGFLMMLKSPVINEDKKIKILEAIFSDKVDELSLRFFRITVQKRREYYLPKIANAFLDQYNVLNSITKIKLTTASPLGDSLQKEIGQIVMEASEVKEIDLSLEVDKKIIGGLILQYEDKLYDASISAKLEELQKEFDKNTYIKKY